MVLHTTVLLRREHRRPPVLLPATTGHVHETIDDLAKTSRNTSLSLSLPPPLVSCFWLKHIRSSHVWVYGRLFWSLPVWRRLKNQTLLKSKSKKDDKYSGWSLLSWCHKFTGLWFTAVQFTKDFWEPFILKNTTNYCFLNSLLFFQIYISVAIIVLSIQYTTEILYLNYSNLTFNVKFNF